MANLHSRDIRDGIEWARRQHSNLHTQVANARPCFTLSETGRSQIQKYECDEDFLHDRLNMIV
jgi:hypothetical protein